MIAEKQYNDKSYAGFYNVGPAEKDCVTTGELVDLFCNTWGEGSCWENRFDGGPHEANFLKLDCSKLKNVFGWKPKLGVSEAIQMTVEWTKCWMSGGDIEACMEQQIRTFFEE